jgi:hypothetical protein
MLIDAAGCLTAHSGNHRAQERRAERLDADESSGDRRLFEDVEEPGERVRSPSVGLVK